MLAKEHEKEQNEEQKCEKSTKHKDIEMKYLE